MSTAAQPAPLYAVDATCKEPLSEEDIDIAVEQTERIQQTGKYGAATAWPRSRWVAAVRKARREAETWTSLLEGPNHRFNEYTKVFKRVVYEGNMEYWTCGRIPYLASSMDKDVFRLTSKYDPRFSPPQVDLHIAKSLDSVWFRDCPLTIAYLFRILVEQCDMGVLIHFVSALYAPLRRPNQTTRLSPIAVHLLCTEHTNRVDRISYANSGVVHFLRNASPSPQYRVGSAVENLIGQFVSGHITPKRPTKEYISCKQQGKRMLSEPEEPAATKKQRN